MIVELAEVNAVVAQRVLAHVAFVTQVLEKLFEELLDHNGGRDSR
jgi:hypothetical protein